jgi:hypothetical protein
VIVDRNEDYRRLGLGADDDWDGGEPSEAARAAARTRLRGAAAAATAAA